MLDFGVSSSLFIEKSSRVWCGLLVWMCDGRSRVRSRAERQQLKMVDQTHIGWTVRSMETASDTGGKYKKTFH